MSQWYPCEHRLVRFLASLVLLAGCDLFAVLKIPSMKTTRVERIPFRFTDVPLD